MYNSADDGDCRKPCYYHGRRGVQIAGDRRSAVSTELIGVWRDARRSQTAAGLPPPCPSSLLYYSIYRHILCYAAATSSYTPATPAPPATALLYPRFAFLSMRVRASACASRFPAEAAHPFPTRPSSSSKSTRPSNPTFALSIASRKVSVMVTGARFRRRVAQP